MPEPSGAQEVFARAAEHVVKFTNTLLDTAATTGSTGALVAAVRACELIDRVRQRKGPRR
ncbi:hypothetical protein [Streptomyces adonidis]|uniref:hypothetical protein n=1 Tax=Streptomyces adonidis TaxID=3231367 RepID=UPI0034DAF9C0